MKYFFVKIASIFFLTVLLASNTVNLHVYFHGEIEDVSHYQNDYSDHNDDNNDKKTPCDLCLLAFNLNSLDYNNGLEFSFKSINNTEELPHKEILSYVELLHKKSYLHKLKNKAPPYLS